ncbi:helix-turn-helix domain-containing protein [Ktedonospora formicarum]|uniref:LysR family transcriptional regulator n=1 Tax=Ktedonospora formicarum TaxID=2778364 RepID=UPI001C68F9A2
MENDLLHSFIHVIDAGSFSKAAEKLYISSTALMKQGTPERKPGRQQVHQQP